jgi:hypothetical protein
MVATVLEVREPDPRYIVAPTLVDSCVLIDVLADDPKWAEWSMQKLEALGNQAPLVINPLILAEISPRFARASDLEAALESLPLRRFWRGKRSRSIADPKACSARPCQIFISALMRCSQACACSRAMPSATLLIFPSCMWSRQRAVR